MRRDHQVRQAEQLHMRGNGATGLEAPDAEVDAVDVGYRMAGQKHVAEPAAMILDVRIDQQRVAPPRRVSLKPGLVRRKAPFHLLQRDEVGIDLVDDRSDPRRIPLTVDPDSAVNIVGSDYYGRCDMKHYAYIGGGSVKKKPIVWPFHPMLQSPQRSGIISAADVHNNGRTGMKYPFDSALLAALALLSAPASAADRTLDTQSGRIAVATLARGLDHPWGMAFLPDGRLLVTERAGRLRIVARDGKLSAPVSGAPKVYAEGQGGLLDVALDPAFASNGLVYLSYAEGDDDAASTAVARAKLAGGALQDLRVIFRQQPKVSEDKHFGGRLVFAPNGNLFVTLGERFQFDPAQDLSTHLGKIVRIRPNGSAPPDNPFVGRQDAKPEIWSYGHRNVQGAAIHPTTGKLWISEFGPRGGDEINIPEPGRNYGWPLVSWGRHYNLASIPKPTTRPDLAPSIYHWNPVISPSGIAFYTGDVFPRWRGNLLIAGLSSEALVRLTLDGERVTGEERIDMDARVRDVEQGPDGRVYLLTDDSDGEILRLAPAEP